MQVTICLVASSNNQQDMITALKDLFQQWEANIRDAVDSDLLRNAAFSKHLKLSRKLLVVVEKTNSSLSPFLFCTYVYFLVAGVSFSYMGLAVALTFEHRAGLFLAIGINIYSLMAFWYMWTTSSLGEGMENSKKKARYGKITAGTIVLPHCTNQTLPRRSALFELSIGCGLDEDTRDKRNDLMESLDNAKISPYNYFVVDNANLLGMFASVITYLIVLLQFRTA